MEGITEIVNDEALAEQHFDQMMADQGVEKATTCLLHTLSSPDKHFSPLFVYRFLKAVETQWVLNNHESGDVYEQLCLTLLQYARRTKRPDEVIATHRSKLAALIQPKKAYAVAVRPHADAGYVAAYEMEGKDGKIIVYVSCSPEIMDNKSYRHKGRITVTPNEPLNLSLLDSFGSLLTSVRGNEERTQSLSHVLDGIQQLFASEEKTSKND